MTSAIILAAGDGKRMKSSKQKVCCEVLFKPMLSWVLDACQNAKIPSANTCVVISDSPRGVTELLPTGVSSVVQSNRRGTGHAVLCAMDFLKNAVARGVSHVAVLCGDAPFIDADTLQSAFSFHKAQQNDVTVLTAVLDDPGRYGRIVREQRRFTRITEAADASEQELLIDEVNSGAYWFSISYLISSLPLLGSQNAQGEYYLTDLVGLATSSGRRAGAFICPNPDIALGANDRRSLATLNHIARDAVLERHYENGVDIPIADGVIIGPDVKIGCDTTILPGTILCGSTVIGEGCTVGPNTRIIDCKIGADCVIDSARLEKSRIGCDVRIGPFTQVRPHCDIANGVKIGNFVELKNSTVGEKTSFAHLTYIGDSDFGSRINVGCGVVTVNYNGREKFRTIVEDDAFIGCNTNLIAPVQVQKGAYVAAATTVTTDIPPDALAVGRIKQTIYPGRAIYYRKK
ncbi:MAG: bifunctional UDP-N-acetylglucosamine diphosphorylase/glucosamine-1-phosphate N-acetyltransferase GlmU [Candidatus Fimivivens sp.]